MLPRKYTAYGLIFESELEIPELLEGSGASDVSVNYGEVPDHLDSPVEGSELYEVDENQFLLRLDGIARYWVVNGDRIVVQPAPYSQDSEVRLFLFGTCLGVLLHQRGILALHASAIETSRGAVLFTGPSGIGKSTLMAAFLKKGYYMLADDISGIVLDRSGQPIVLPAMPRTKLWSDTVKHLGHDLSTLPRLRPNEDKFGVSMHERFSHRPVRLARIYMLSTSTKNEIKISPFDNLNSFKVVLSNTFREHFLDGLDRRKTHFYLATNTAKSARISLVTRPRDSFQLDELVESIEADFTSQSEMPDHPTGSPELARLIRK